MKKFTEHFKSWLSGFIDGEGCFIIDPKAGTHYFRVRFVIHLRADDLDIIKEIKQYLGGMYYFRPYYQDKDNYCHSPQVCYHLNGAKNCLRLIKHLEKYPLQAKKREDFEIWREAIYLLIGKEHLKGKRDYLLYLCDKIKKVRQYEKVKMPEAPVDRQLILLVGGGNGRPPVS